MNLDATRLEVQLGPQVSVPVQRLRMGLKRYLLSIAPIFDWTPQRRKQKGQHSCVTT